MNTETSSKTIRSSRRFGTPALALAVVATAIIAGGGTWLLAGGRGHAHRGETAATKEQWQCPMHPSIVQDHPGDCPICGMKLVKVAAAAPAGGARAEGTQAPAKEQWQCPMHPSIIQDHPGDCPICGMKLVKMASTGADAKAERKLLFYRSPMDPKQTSPTPRKDEMGMDYLPVYSDEVGGGGAVEGLTQVTIDATRQQLIGLRTAEVAHGPIGGLWRTVGRVSFDETRVRHINLKVPGYIERIYVDFVGKPVRIGEPLFSLYSPDLFSTQQEYLLALRTRDELARAGGQAGDGEALVRAARRKLQLWDVPQSELERLEKNGEPMKNLTFRSPINGVVTKKDAFEGMKLEAGAMPYELVDLSQVWVLADVYESELRFVKMGMPADLSLKAYPNRVFKGRVSFIDPVLDPKTRTVKVRLAFPNPTGELKPEMFGDVVLRGKPREGLRVPVDAVIDSGTQKVVFVAVGDGRFQPREVQIGESDRVSAEVVSGLAVGEKVVMRANFLVDSESRLRASLAALSSGSGAPGGTGHADTAATPSQPAAGDAPGANPHAGHGR